MDQVTVYMLPHGITVRTMLKDFLPLPYSTVHLNQFYNMKLAREILVLVKSRRDEPEHMRSPIRAFAACTRKIVKYMKMLAKY